MMMPFRLKISGECVIIHVPFMYCRVLDDNPFKIYGSSASCKLLVLLEMIWFKVLRILQLKLVSHEMSLARDQEKIGFRVMLVEDEMEDNWKKKNQFQMRKNFGPWIKVVINSSIISEKL